MRQRTSRIVDFERALEELRAPALYRFYGATLYAGRAARLLETIRGHDVLSKTKVYDFASQFGYSPDFVDGSLFPKFEDWGFVSLDKDRVSISIKSPGEILDLCGKDWEARPKDLRDAHAVDVVDLVTKRPILIDDLRSRVFRDTPRNVQDEVLMTLEALNIVVPQETNEGKLYYTPHYVGANPDQLSKLVTTLKEAELRAIEAAYDEVSAAQGYPVSSLVGSKTGITEGVLSTSTLGGLLNVCEVTTPHDSKRFVFTGDILPPEGVQADPLHFTKQTVAHFRYAQAFARFRLTRLPRFLEVLLEKGQAGAASPIGTDYKFLEQNGIVEVQQLGSSGKYTMYLVKGKEDLLRATIDLISSGTPPIPKVEEVPLAEQLRRIKVPPEHRVGLDPAKIQGLLSMLVGHLRRPGW